MNSTQTKGNQEISSQDRMHWLDGMKAIGITIIVAGHYTPPCYEYLYTFSVQMFFIMSGFLVKPSLKDRTTEIKKIVKQLIVPMLILAVIYNILFAISQVFFGEISIKQLLNNLFGIITGDVFALAGLWFVYTLILIRILSVYSHKYIKPIIAFACVLTSIYLCESGKEFHSTFVNALLAYPCFYIGELFGLFKDKINNINNLINLALIIGVGFACTLIAYKFNGTAWMYLGGYGGNILYFLLGSLGGTAMCYGVCKLLFLRKNKYTLIIAEGTILILAFHGLVIRLTHQIDAGHFFYLESVVLVIAFIPLIILSQKYFPIILGYRGSKK